MTTPLEFTGLPEWAQILILATVTIGFLIAIATLGRKLWRWLTTAIAVTNALGNPKVITALNDLPQFMITTAHTLADQDQKIEEIHHEVQFNNGSSVKDAVTRMETKQKSVLAAQRRIERGVAGLYTRVDANEVAANQDRADIAAARQELEDTRPARIIKTKE